MSTPTISGVVSTMSTGIVDQLWLIAPIGLGIAAVVFGVPKGVSFLKKLAK